MKWRIYRPGLMAEWHGATMHLSGWRIEIRQAL
jgi:hypothetical protein